MKSEKFYDFDSNHPNQVEPRYNRDDLLDTDDNNPVLCDICNDGIKLIEYPPNSLICPRCMHVYNPTFDTIKHEAIETTIEEMQDSHSGTMSYVEDTKHENNKTRIRKKLASEDALPQYVKDEIAFIQWRKGYKAVPLDKKLSSSRTK